MERDRASYPGLVVVMGQTGRILGWETDEGERTGRLIFTPNEDGMYAADQLHPIDPGTIEARLEAERAEELKSYTDDEGGR